VNIPAVTARLSIHVPDEAVHVCELGDATEARLGRDPRCEILVDHHSISRLHLRLQRDDDGRWLLQDLGSKNGTRIGGRTVSGQQAIEGGDWFAAGDVYVRFDMVSLAAERDQREEVDRRRRSSMIWNSRLRHGSQAQRLIADLLRGIVDVAEAQRGFLLSADGKGEWRVRACYAIGPDELSRQAFSGSRSAIDRAIHAKRSVYLSDQRDQAWLQEQASVLDAGIRALLAIPLMRDGRVVGVVYADTNDAERVYTDLDAQLLDALVDHAGNVMSALELEAGLAEVSRLLRIGSDGMSAELGPAPHWSSTGRIAQDETSA
jgi:hypothetical protein